MTRPAAATIRPNLSRREAVFTGAIRAFARSGYAGTSLREIASEADMEKGHLTYYFPTKEQILFEVVDDLHLRFLNGIQTWVKETPTKDDEALLHVFQSHLRVILGATEQTAVAYDNFRFLTGERRAVVLRRRRDYELILERFIDACRAGASIDDTATRLLTKSALAQLNWPYKWYSPAGALSDEELVLLLARRALAVLRPL
jgi:AcrR family transcriptional regulator